jgi:hypothetical protein
VSSLPTRPTNFPVTRSDHRNSQTNNVNITVVVHFITHFLGFLQDKYTQMKEKLRKRHITKPTRKNMYI